MTAMLSAAAEDGLGNVGTVSVGGTLSMEMVPEIGRPRHGVRCWESAGRDAERTRDHAGPRRCQRGGPPPAPRTGTTRPRRPSDRAAVRGELHARGQHRARPPLSVICAVTVASRSAPRGRGVEADPNPTPLQSGRVNVELRSWHRDESLKTLPACPRTPLRSSVRGAGEGGCRRGISMVSRESMFSQRALRIKRIDRRIDRGGTKPPWSARTEPPPELTTKREWLRQGRPPPSFPERLTE